MLSYEGPQNEDSNVNMFGILKVSHKATRAVPSLLFYTIKLQSLKENGSYNLDMRNGSSLQASGCYLS